jgi:NB-ARC domain
VSKSVQKHYIPSQLLSQQDIETMDQVPLQDEARSFDCHASSCSRSLATVQDVSAPLLPSKVKLLCRYNIPEHINRPFFGRGKALSRLDSFFPVEENSVARGDPAPPRRFILSGLGGCGKTQIALKYVNRHLQRFDIILWFRSNTAVCLAQNYHAAAQDLGLVEYQVKQDHIESRQKLRWWLGAASHPFLLIFDDVQNYAMLEKYIPHSSQGQIIIISRKTYRSQDRGESQQIAVEIGPMSMEEAVSCLQTLVPRAIEEADPAAPRAIAEQLGNFILLEDGGLFASLRQSWQNGERSMNFLLPSIKEVNLRFSRRADFAGYCPMFHWSDFSKPAASMMSVLCFLDSGQVSESILLSAVLDSDLPSKEFPCSDGAYCSARSELLIYDVCSRSRSDRSLCTHSLMADNMRASMGPTLFETGFKIASRLLMKVWPSRRKLPNILRTNWPEFDALHNHVWKLASAYGDRRVI